MSARLMGSRRRAEGSRERERDDRHRGVRETSVHWGVAGRWALWAAVVANDRGSYAEEGLTLLPFSLYPAPALPWLPQPKLKSLGLGAQKHPGVRTRGMEVKCSHLYNSFIFEGRAYSGLLDPISFPPQNGKPGGYE